LFISTVQQVDTDEEETPVDVQALEQIHTYLHQQITGPFFMYNKVNWSLEVRKEVSKYSHCIMYMVLYGII